jgi:hypothetical protein
LRLLTSRARHTRLALGRRRAIGLGRGEDVPWRDPDPDTQRYSHTCSDKFEVHGHRLVSQRLNMSLESGPDRHSIKIAARIASFAVLIDRANDWRMLAQLDRKRPPRIHRGVWVRAILLGLGQWQRPGQKISMRAVRRCESQALPLIDQLPDWARRRNKPSRYISGSLCAVATATTLPRYR